MPLIMNNMLFWVKMHTMKRTIELEVEHKGIQNRINIPHNKRSIARENMEQNKEKHKLVPFAE